MPPPDQRRQRRIAIVVASVFCAVMVALGGWSIVEGDYEGVTKRGTAISLHNDSARWMGAVQVCIGMLMLSIAMPNQRAALRWALAWVALAALCFVAGYRVL